MDRELQARLLSSVRNAADFRRLEGAGFTGDDFPDYGPMHGFIKQMVMAHGKVPRLIDLRQTFNLPKSVRRTPTEFPVLFDEYRKMRTATHVQTILDDTVSEHASDPDALVSGLILKLSGINTVGEAETSVTDRDVRRRLEEYEKRGEQRTRQGGMHGIRTGMTYFDDVAGLGWLPGELIGLVGRTFIGKSWLLVNFGVMAWGSGKKVLFISPEMPIDEAEARFDALHFGRKSDIKVSATDLFRGFTPSAEMKREAGRVSQSGRWITQSTAAGGQLTLAELARAIRQHRPDLMLIDGLPLLEMEGKASKQIWEEIKVLSYGLKRLAVSQSVAMIVTHQANRKASNVHRAPALHEISLGDSFGQACDRVLALSKVKDELGDLVKDAIRVSVQKFRKNRAMPEGVIFDFDPERGKIHERFGDEDELVRSGTDGVGHSGGLPEAESGVGEPVSLP